MAHPASRLLFLVALALVLFLALTPGPMGQIVESGPLRHLMAFAALPVLSSLAWPRVNAVWQFLGYAAFGAGIELVQLWMNLGRMAQWEDWANDVAATAVALALVALAQGWTRRPAGLEAR